MARFERGRKFLIVVGVMLLAGLLSDYPARAQSDRESTFVIEGKDRQPGRSVFEYDSDTESGTSAIGTSDRPDAPIPESIDDPKLDKERLFSDSPESRGEGNTVVNEYGTLEMVAIGFGVVAVLLAL